MKYFSYEYAASSWPRFAVTMAAQFIQDSAITVCAVLLGMELLKISIALHLI